MTFADYYLELQKREGLDPINLVDSWQTELIEQVAGEFTNAVDSQSLKNSICQIRPGSKNQSIGNQVEAFVVPKLAAGLEVCRLEECSGPGYPDRQLRVGMHLIALELKATGDWNPADSNRRVLTSSSGKIRRRFQSPIHHLLCTVVYATEPAGVIIKAVRLDFLEPTSEVNVRLEASVSHRLLNSGAHRSLII